MAILVVFRSAGSGKNTMSKKLTGFIVVLLCIGVSGIAHSDDLRVYSEKRVLMATTVEIQVVVNSEAEGKKLVDDAFGEVARLEHLLSSYIDSSDITRINDAAGKAPVKVSDHTFRVIEKALEVGSLSKGAFDISYKPLAVLWKKYSPRHIPSNEEIEETMKLVGYQNIRLNQEEKTVFLTREKMVIDTGGLAKGYIVDKTLEFILSRGYQNCLVNAGGDLRASGKHITREWTTGIQHPRMKSVLASLPVNDEAIVTSGDYERYIVIDGKKYAHIINPQTGYPVDEMISVTVIAPTALEADAFSTAVFVLGMKEGYELIESQKNIEALLIDANGKVRFTSGLATTKPGETQ